MTTRIKTIRKDLEELLEYTKTEEPKLYERLSNIWRWIKDKKDGLITSKRYVLNLLEEIVKDSVFWLEYQTCTIEERTEVEQSLNSSRQYWSLVLFPSWFSEPDPKLGRWKKKLMNNEYTNRDHRDIFDTCEAIERRGGNTNTRYILDLSMATDLIVSTDSCSPLSVQLTTVSIAPRTSKKKEWIKTLNYWKIQRGLLVSYNPRRNAGFRAWHILEKCKCLKHGHHTITL